MVPDVLPETCVSRRSLVIRPSDSLDANEASGALGWTVVSSSAEAAALLPPGSYILSSRRARQKSGRTQQWSCLAEHGGQDLIKRG